MEHWRIVFTGAGDAFFNMALDEAILQSCQRGYAPPTLRLYLWRPPAISIGYSQPAQSTVDIGKCRENDIDVVRRITGGRAVLHQNEMTYSVCASVREYPQLGEDINDTYQKISFALLESLKGLNIQAEWVKPHREGIGSTGNYYFSKPCFMSISRYEITVEGKKLIGSSQRRFQDSLIQHGSIPLGHSKLNLADLLSIESFGSETKDRSTVKKKLEENSTSLGRVLKREVECEEVVSALKKGFGKFFDAEMDERGLSPKEIETARALTKKKYSTDNWNLRKTRGEASVLGNSRCWVRESVCQA